MTENIHNKYNDLKNHLIIVSIIKKNLKIGPLIKCNKKKTKYNSNNKIPNNANNKFL